MAGLRFLGESGALPRIDRYELVAEIASGGMATVYLARMQGLGGFERFVALKRLHPHLEQDESFVRMFLDEARLVAGIRHPHVVPVLEVGAGDSGYYLVMEYIEGLTLAAVLARSVRGDHPIPPRVAIRVMLDVLAGLHEAHELRDSTGSPVGLVHRDVSPQNILIDINGIARIADFGVAHATSRLGSTRAGQLKGKVAYMAPEQARGEPITRRADVFAAAIVLWESLCLQRLFMADNEAVTLNRLIFEPIPKLREVKPSLPLAIEKVLDRALDRNVERRYATAADFAQELETAARVSRMLGEANEVRRYLLTTLAGEHERMREAIRAHLANVDRSRAELLNTPAEVAVPTAELTSSSGIMEVPTQAEVLSQPQPPPQEMESPAGLTKASSKTGLIIGVAALLSVVVLGALAWSVRSQPDAAGDASPATPTAEPVPATSAIAPAVHEPAQPPPTQEPDDKDAQADQADADRADARSTVTQPRPVRTAVTPPKPQPASEPSSPPPVVTSVAPDSVVPAAADDLKANPYR